MSIYSAIREYALKEANGDSPQECCGLILEGPREKPELVPTKNIHIQPSHFFQIPGSAYLEAYRTRRLIAFYHSHVFSSEEFSAMDRRSSEEAGFPLFVYSIKTDKLGYYCPESAAIPLEGRRFVQGVRTCYTLVLDYYAMRKKVALKYFDFRAAKFGRAELIAAFSKTGWTKIPEPVVGCTVIISLRDHPDHMGIYLGEGKILHHVRGELSCVQQFSEILRSKTVCQFMPEKLMAKKI